MGVLGMAIGACAFGMIYLIGCVLLLAFSEVDE